MLVRTHPPLLETKLAMELMGPLRLWLASPRRSTLLLVCNGTRQTTHYQNYSAPTLLSRPTSASYTTNWLLLPSPVTVSSRTASNYALQIKRESHNGPLVSTRWICNILTKDLFIRTCRLPVLRLICLFVPVNSDIVDLFFNTYMHRNPVSPTSRWVSVSLGKVYTCRYRLFC